MEKQQCILLNIYLPLEQKTAYEHNLYKQYEEMSTFPNKPDSY